MQTCGQRINSVIELRANVDNLGGINVSPIATKTTKNMDSLVIYIDKINRIIIKSKTAIKVINDLVKEGWILLSVVSISKDDMGRPNSPFISYYFRYTGEVQIQ